ncbi:MAG: PilZ domain-containing protein [Candidatus Omnitrophica bacterium]|nr:PilZ domain-containing protein [Candidatus Omnitrophota bacterium]
MILVIQLILVSVLFLILIALYVDEKHKHKFKIPTGILTQFWDGSERRRFVRVDADIPVKYSLSLKPNGTSVVKTADISIGGVCITLAEKLTPKQNLAVEIGLPDAGKSAIVAKGRVAWVKESESQSQDGIRYFTAGIEFCEISRNGMACLLNFVKNARGSQTADGESKSS